MHRFSSHRDGSKRWFLYAGKFHFQVEISTRWRSGFHATWAYGGQDGFCEWTLAFPRLFFAHFGVETPYSWHKLRPFDGKYGEKERTFGLRTIGRALYLEVGHDRMGSQYSTHGRLGWFRRGLLKNQEIALFRSEWITGRDRYEATVLDERPVEIVIDRWPGDRYPATQRVERCTWRNRFRTLTRVAYEWSLPSGAHGIPSDPHGKWGDLYQETYGFGASAVDTDDVPALIAAAPEALRDRLLSLLSEWPEGMVPSPEWFAETFSSPAVDGAAKEA